ncbi:hypothetical protein CGRA01v4_14232 [Colletotrichum graminicola]|uniref:Uncharacterized protein n=1 Tax=Colletotrichum graminicola (strain M1.001 / M2 / FGSC 10212) TaxID=645133 RepID=E3Q565_COLGM|nr:uncharacterized protein GLRG_00976 [Colletotrichum graminicola M1.001]EFQ25832.1 hypothetical protein GLRG_00976 [Colletotrichum graminicola M1.001]WDK22941.1 hypothetical protein CGRA01v4_14232 [Colletotrichum graminicola]
MLTETARDMYLKATANRARTIKREIDRIINLASLEEFATIAAQVPIPDDPDWDLFEPPQESSDIGLSTWSDSEDVTTNLNATGSRVVNPFSTSNGILDEKNLQDSRSDNSSLARLVDAFRIRVKRGSNDSTARKAGDIQITARDAINNKKQSINGLIQAINPSESLTEMVMQTISLTPRSHDRSVYRRKPHLIVENVNKFSSNIPPKDQTHKIVVYDQFSAKHPSDLLKTNLKEYFIQLSNEAVRVQSLSRFLKSQESASMQTRRGRRQRIQNNIAHPLRQSDTMEEYKAKQEAILDKTSYMRMVRW